MFAYTVLSAGIFSAQKGQEVIYTGLKQARSSMSVVGGVTAKDTDSDNKVDEFWFVVSSTLDGEAIDLTNTTDGDTNACTYGDTDARSYGNANTRAYSDADAYGDADARTYGNTDPHAHAYGNA